MRSALILLSILASLLAGCGAEWNDPYPASERGKNILYTSFVTRPKHLDPAQSYTEDESAFIQQIYEPPLQYHYLKRPYELVPLAATEVPKPESVEGGKYTVYEIHIQRGIRYQPHPAFVAANRRLARRRIASLASPYDLPSATRELVADDYIYEIKRLAHPRLQSPIFGLMAGYIVGLREYAARLRKAGSEAGWLDLRKDDISGVQRVDRYTLRIKLYGSYPQFVYWLAMPFFSPVPWEADQFYSQPGMAEKNFVLDWWPVGTGPYMMTHNNPNARIELARNPNFHGEAYPSSGEPADAAAGLLKDAGKPMPFIDRVVFSREKEAIPYWNKFLQGYYDMSGISSDQFDQAVRVSVEGDASVSPEMQRRGIRLSTSVEPSILYVAFNWNDPVVGGASQRARKLRQAISIAFDVEEQIAIFANGRGIAADGPLPPGIFGHREGEAGVNRVVYDWRDGKAERKSIDAARRLMAQAGYPGGRDARTGAPLVLYFDTVSRGPGDKALFDWYRRQLAKLSIQLIIRDTDWNRFQEKIRTGATQMFRLGWNADYPDPENFLFLLYGPNAKSRGEGENASNYSNPEFDALFEKMKDMSNSPERQKIIDRMVEIVRNDAPWIWGLYPKDYVLRHAWLSNDKPNAMARNNVKYLRLDPALRAAERREWNRPVAWPLGLLLLALAASAVPAVLAVRRRERMAARPPEPQRS